MSLRAGGRVVEALPAGELVEHVEPELVRGLEKRGVGWIVRHAHGVHVGALDQANIGVVLLACQRAASLRVKAVAIDALEHDLAAVEIDAVARTDFERAEAEALAALVQ